MNPKDLLQKISDMELQVMLQELQRALDNNECPSPGFLQAVNRRLSDLGVHITGSNDTANEILATAQDIDGPDGVRLKVIGDE